MDNYALAFVFIVLLFIIIFMLVRRYSDFALKSGLAIIGGLVYGGGAGVLGASATARRRPASSEKPS
jgi:hypothetical protein